MNSSSNQKSAGSTLYILAKSSLFGLFRGLFGLPFEHPFDCVKTNMQAYQNGLIQTFKNIYSESGIKGFYSGFGVNSLRVALKQVYRWPLQIATIDFLKTLFNQKLSRAALGVLSGIGIAVIEVGIICPFERIKVWLMTAHLKQKGMRLYFKTFPLKSLYDGFYPLFWKAIISWVTFLGTTELLKQMVYKYAKKDRMKESLSGMQIACVSTGVALINTLFVLPFDCVKTNYQKFSSFQPSTKEPLSLSKVAIDIYRKHGKGGLFKGWQSKLIQYSINSLLTVTVFEDLLKQYESRHSKSQH